jgi:hypothetical protein
MKIDLLATTCFSHETDNFGIDDDKVLPTEPAKIVPFDNGIAKVQNPHNYSIYFVPLDKNIECLRPDGTQESQCDALLICLRPQNKYDFYFVELKEANKTIAWIADGTEQLKTTILNFKENYNLSCLSKQSAFLANKSHPNYHYKHTALMEKFRNETGFRLNICAIIPIN